jgi:hypothetical protein
MGEELAEVLAAVVTVFVGALLIDAILTPGSALNFLSPFGATGGAIASGIASGAAAAGTAAVVAGSAGGQAVAAVTPLTIT